MGSESEEIQAGGMYNEATSVEEARNKLEDEGSSREQKGETGRRRR